MEEQILSPLASGTGDNFSGRGGISCHCFNKDKTSEKFLHEISNLSQFWLKYTFMWFTVVAICPNNNEIHIYETSTWTRLHSLAEVNFLFLATQHSWMNMFKFLARLVGGCYWLVWSYKQDSILFPWSKCICLDIWP